MKLVDHDASNELESHGEDEGGDPLDGQGPGADGVELGRLHLDPGLLLGDQGELGQLAPQVSDGRFTFVTAAVGYLRHVGQSGLCGGVQALNTSHQSDEPSLPSPVGSHTPRSCDSD